MGKQEIVDRILADAAAEADEIIAVARESAARLIAEAEARAEGEMQETRRQTEAKAAAISEGKAAAARLDGAKILLGEKRRALDAIYGKAAEKLASMSVKSYLALADKLISEYAEEGDEIVFAKGFPCAPEVFRLKAVSDKKLKMSFKAADIDGGFMLLGKTADKDLSFGALLAGDRARHEAEIASQIFNVT